MRRKPTIKYTEMAKYVDDNIDSPNRDDEKIIDYLTMLAYMLACKKRYFNTEEDYDNFSKFIAGIVFMRMTTPRIHLDKDDKNYIEPIKSCLNYMKKILYGRKCVYMSQEFGGTTNTSTEDEACMNYATSAIKTSNNDMMYLEIDLYIQSIDKIIKKLIYDGVYGKDKVLCFKLYTSCLLSLLRNFTLSRKNINRVIDSGILNDLKEKGIKEIKYKTNYYDLIESFLEEETKNAPILYDLDDEYLDYIALTTQKAKIELVKDIAEITSYYNLTDEMVIDILMSSYRNLNDEN